MPTVPPSRPSPDCLMPPNGAAGLDDEAGVEPDHAGLQRLADPQRPRQVLGEQVADQPELGVVGRGDGLVLGVEHADRRHRPEDLLLGQPRVERDVGEHRGRVEVAGPVDRVAADADASRRGRRRRRPARRPSPGPSRRPAGRPATPVLGAPARRAARAIRSASRSANSSATERCTRKRLAAVQASPMLRILAIIAPSTAASRSASSNTRNGALPPSSIDVRRTLSAACSSSVRPDRRRPGERQLAGPAVADQRLHDRHPRWRW